MADDINSIINQAAAQYGVDPSLMHQIAGIESGGDPHAVSPTGAAGLFQFTGGTAKQYGLSNRFDPTASAGAAAQLIKDNNAALSKSLGRAPTPGEQYLAYQQGAAGATALLKNPSTNAVEALTPVYGSQDKAATAIMANGGSPNMTAGQFSGMWTKAMTASPNAAGGADPPAAATPPAPGIGASAKSMLPGMAMQMAGNLSKLGSNIKIPVQPMQNSPLQAPPSAAPGITMNTAIPLPIAL